MRELIGWKRDGKKPRSSRIISESRRTVEKGTVEWQSSYFESAGRSQWGWFIAEEIDKGSN